MKRKRTKVPRRIDCLIPQGFIGPARVIRKYGIPSVRSFVYIVFSLSIVFFHEGCTVHHIPKDLSVIQGAVQPFSIGETVKLINAQAFSKEVLTTSRGYDLPVNYKQYTESAIQLMEKEIEKNGGIVSEGASKAIHLSIVNVSLTKSLMRYRSIIDATIQIGKGHVQGYNSTASGGLEEAVDLAIAKLVVSILNDQKVRSYLK